MTPLVEKSVIKGLIRPKKIAFLLPYSISDDDFRELLSFIGTLWGGKYCCIIPFDSDGRNNDLGLSWLYQYQPDVILWLEGSCNDKWIEEIKDLTSPLNIRTIQLPLEENYRVNYTKIFHYWSVLEHYSTKIRSLPDTTTRFKFISTEKNIKNRIFYDLSFGATEKKNCTYLAELLRADSKHISEADIYDYIELQSNNKKPFTFLDASSIEVDTVNAFSQNTPTIFILSTSIVDYTWFWNQRAKFNVGACIAIPLDTLDDKVIKLSADLWF